MELQGIIEKDKLFNVSAHTLLILNRAKRKKISRKPRRWLSSTRCSYTISSNALRCSRVPRQQRSSKLCSKKFFPLMRRGCVVRPRTQRNRPVTTPSGLCNGWATTAMRFTKFTWLLTSSRSLTATARSQPRGKRLPKRWLSKWVISGLFSTSSLTLTLNLSRSRNSSTKKTYW